MYSEEVKESLKEINRLLAFYNPFEMVWAAIVLIIMVGVMIFLYSQIGIWADVILILAFLLWYTNKGKKDNGKPSKEELSEAVCQLMSFCVNEQGGARTPDGRKFEVLCYGLDGNLSLYESFIKYFPHMASYKLRKLASVKIGI